MSSDFTIVRIDASARVERSLSRALADRFVREWRARQAGVQILGRDVGLAPPPPVSEQWIAAAFTPAAERTPREPNKRPLQRRRRR